MNTEKKENNSLIHRLQKLKEDRGSMSNLRRYWSETTRHYATMELGRIGILNSASDSITAALYAIHPKHQKGEGLGNSLRKMVRNTDQENAFEPHFRRLLVCQTLDECQWQLYRMFKRLEKVEIGVDFEKLMWDLRKFDNDTDEIKQRWAGNYWQVAERK